MYHQFNLDKNRIKNTIIVIQKILFFFSFRDCPKDYLGEAKSFFASPFSKYKKRYSVKPIKTPKQLLNLKIIEICFYLK
jgi:hypothetical protein